MRNPSIFFLILSVLIGCTASKKPQENNITEYRLFPPEADAGGTRPPEEHYGRVVIGGDDVRLGHKDSRAVKTINCGNGNRCRISVSVGSDVGGANDTFKDSEEVKITFTWGTDSTRTHNYGTFQSYPHIVDIPACGNITINIGMTEGNTAGLRSRASIWITAACYP